MIGYMDAHQGLARTLATLMATRSKALAEGSQTLERTVTDLMAAAVRDGAVMMALHGIGAAQDHPGWRAQADGIITLLLDGLRHRAQATR